MITVFDYLSYVWFLQLDTPIGLLVLGIMRRLRAMSLLEVRRRCSSWRVVWKLRNTSCLGGTSASLDALVLASRNTLIWESSMLVYFFSSLNYMEGIINSSSSCIKILKIVVCWQYYVFNVLYAAFLMVGSLRYPYWFMSHMNEFNDVLVRLCWITSEFWVYSIL